MLNFLKKSTKIKYIYYECSKKRNGYLGKVKYEKKKTNIYYMKIVQYI